MKPRRKQPDASNEIVISRPAPHAGQLRVIEERKRFNVLECGRRFGKTVLGERLLFDEAKRGEPVAWFAPSYRYLLDVWDRLEAQCRPLIVKANKTESQIKLSTGGVMDFWTLENEDAGRGRKYARVILDEAGIVRNLQKIWQEAIRPTLTDLRGDAWFLFTPKGRNFAHQLYAKGEAKEKGWASWRFPSSYNPFLSAEEIEGAKKELPEHVYQQEYEGIPADDAGNPFGLSAIRACIIPTLPASDPIVFGVDLAKSQDYTVVCGLDAEGRVCILERWQSDWGQTRRRVMDLIGTTPALIDSTGVGDPIVEDLCRERPESIEGFKFTSQSKQQLMEGLAATIQKHEVGVPEGWLQSELESFEYEYTRGGVKYSAPSGLHDDGVMALALAVRKRTLPPQDGLPFTVWSAKTSADPSTARRVGYDEERQWQ